MTGVASRPVGLGSGTISGMDADHLTLDGARELIGQRVTYCPHPGRLEQGRISSVGTAYVYVKYDGAEYPKATRPWDLVRA